MEQSMCKSTKTNNPRTKDDEFVNVNCKTIHTVWIGGAIPDISDSYTEVWEKAYPDFELITWIDRKNLYVNIYNKVIKAYREQELTNYLIANETITHNEYYDKAVAIEVQRRNDENYQHSTDEERINTIERIINEISEVTVKNDLKNLLKEESEKINHFKNKINSSEKKYRDVNDLLKIYEKTLGSNRLNEIYNKEINERGNLAAASDIIRLIALYEHSGVYVDVDLLPVIKPKIFNSIKEVLNKNRKASEYDVYYAVEHFINLKGTRTNSSDLLIRANDYESIKNIITSEKNIFNEIKTPENLAIKRIRGIISNAEISTSILYDEKIKGLLNEIIRGYDIIENVGEYLWKNKNKAVDLLGDLVGELDDGSDKFYMKASSIMALSEYYYDSIYPRESDFILTATLNLTGPTLIDHFLIFNEIECSDSTLASFMTVEEVHSSWVIKENAEHAFIMQKNMKKIKLNDTEKYFSIKTIYEKIRRKAILTHKDEIFITQKYNDYEWKNQQPGTSSVINDLNECFKHILIKESLGGEIATLPWIRPYKELFERPSLSIEHNESTIYKRNLIIQLQSEKNVNKAVLGLLTKNPNSVLLQLDPKNSKFTGMQWNDSTQIFEEITIPEWFSTDTSGRFRFQIVGHGDRKADKFGGMNNTQLQQYLEIIFQPFNSSMSQRIEKFKIDLIGCSLLESNTPIEETVPGKLAGWFKELANDIDLTSDKWSVIARENDVRITREGKKEIFIDGHWLSKEVVNAYLQINKSELMWDDTTQHIIKKPLSHEELVEATKKIDAAILQINILNDDSKEVLLTLHEQASKRIRELLSIEVRPAEHRAQIEKLLLQQIDLVNSAKSWQQAADALHDAEKLSADWRATFNTRENDNHNELLFVNQKSGEKIWVKTDKQIFPAFEKEINSLIEQYSSAVNFDKENSILMPKPNIDDVHAVNTINAAFLLQSLFDTFNGDNNPNTLNWSLQIQHYVGLIQPGIGLAEDTVNLAKLVMTLGKFEYKPLIQASNALNKILPHGSLAHAPGAIGVLLDVVNITGIIGQIVNSTNSIEQNTAIANLTMAGISSGVNLTTLLASTAVAEFLGPLAIPLAGVAIGIPELVSGFSQVAESCKAAVTEYDRVLEGIQTPDRLLNISKDNEKPIWSFNLSAIIHCIDFNNNSVQYGNVTTIGSKGGSLHTVTADLDHFFSGPSIDYSLKLDVYAGLGLNKKTQMVTNMINASIFCLPLGVDTHYNFNYDVFSFHRGMKAIACEKLRAFYGMQFVWKFWQIVTNDYGICHLRPTYAPTTVKVKLNSKNRTLVIPTNWNDEQRKNLAYEISGGGGIYKVILPARPVRIDFVTSQSSDELWFLDITSILAKSETVDGKKITEPLVLSRLNNIKISINGFTIDKYSVGFMDIPSKPLFLLVDLNVQETSLVAEIDFSSGKHSVSLLWNDNPQDFDPAKVVVKTIKTLINYGWTETIPLTIKNDLSITAIVELKNKCILHADKNGLFITRPITESFSGTETKNLIDVRNIGNNYLSLGSSGDLIYFLSTNDIHLQCDLKIPTIFNLNITLNNATKKHTKNNKEVMKEIKEYLGLDYSSFIKLNFPSLMETRLSSITFAPDFIFVLSREKYFNYIMSFNEKKQLHLQSATWKTPEADFIFDDRMILLNASDSSTTLTPSIYDIELSSWTNFEIPLYINPGPTLRHLEINENIWRFISISIINGTKNNGMTIKLSGLTSKSPMERDGVDLIIRTSDRHVIKIINAFVGGGGVVFDDRTLDIEGIGKLLLGIEDHTEAFLIKNEIEKHFTIERVKSFFRNGSEIYFTGDSGVNYILYEDGEVVSDNTEIVINTNIFTIPSGLNALFLLKNIIAGRRVFETEEIDELMLMDQLMLFFDREINLKGKEAIDFLAAYNEGMATLMSGKLVMNNLLDPSDKDTFNLYTKVFDIYIRKGVYA